MRFLKFTAQQFKFKLGDTSNDLLKMFKVDLKDRECQFWQRNPLGIDLWTPAVLQIVGDNTNNGEAG